MSSESVSATMILETEQDIHLDLSKHQSQNENVNDDDNNNDSAGVDSSVVIAAGSTDTLIGESCTVITNKSFDEDDAELGALTEHESPIETPSDYIFTKTKRREIEILGIIDAVKNRNSGTLDLAQKCLLAVPDEILPLSQLESIYLEGNEISFLPDEFFKCFPKLQWLDLRKNCLSRIPTVYLANHSCLRNLLLEGNEIRNLPLELGLVKSLHGLNIACNPIEFPPQEIIEKGAVHILNFLVQMIEAKNSAKMADLDLELSQEVPEGIDLISASSDDWNTTASMMELAKRRQMMKPTQQQVSSGQNEPSSFGTKSVELHRPASYTENRVQHFERLKKAGALGTVEKKKTKKMDKMNWKVNPYPSPPPNDYVTFKMNEEKQLAKVKDLAEKTDAILQRRKDDAHLKSWRDEAKVLQRHKYAQHMVPGEDYDETAEKAPFAVEKENMKVMDKEARMREDKRKEEEIRKQRVVSPATKQRIELQKQANIRELEKRIKDHTSSMAERRKQPKGTPQQEMEIAKRELQVVKTLQRDLMKRYQELKAWSAG